MIDSKTAALWREPLKLWDFMVEGEPGLLRVAAEGFGMKVQWNNYRPLEGYMLGECRMEEAG